MSPPFGSTGLHRGQGIGWGLESGQLGGSKGGTLRVGLGSLDESGPQRVVPRH
jgi:hypothetical protein